MADNTPDEVHIAFCEIAQSKNNNTIIIHDMWLPLAVWDGVNVYREENIELTVFERCFLEAALTLRGYTEEELREALPFPDELFGMLLAALQQKGLMPPDSSMDVTALKSGIAKIKIRSKECFIWFPETNEVVFYKNASTLLKQIGKIPSPAQFPVLSHLSTRTRGDVINQAFASGEVTGAGAGALCGVEDDSELPDFVCAYIAKGSFDLDTKSILLSISSSRESQQDISESKKNTGKLSFTHAQVPKVAKIHLERIQSTLLEHGRKHLASHYFDSRLEFSAGRPVVHLTASGAEKLREGLLLDYRLGLEFKSKVLSCEVPCSLVPADPHASAAMKLDIFIREMLRDAFSPDWDSFAATCAEKRVNIDEVTARLWQRQMYQQTYQIRQARDFCDG